jgi:hypothetical protein
LADDVKTLFDNWLASHRKLAALWIQMEVLRGVFTVADVDELLRTRVELLLA